MSTDTNPASPVRTVVCPACGGKSLYGPDNPSRPFCSARCKGIDFGAWANERFRMPTEVPPDGQDPGPLQ